MQDFNSVQVIASIIHPILCGKPRSNTYLFQVNFSEKNFAHYMRNKKSAGARSCPAPAKSGSEREDLIALAVFAILPSGKDDAPA